MMIKRLTYYNNECITYQNIKYSINNIFIITNTKSYIKTILNIILT